MIRFEAEMGAFSKIEAVALARNEAIPSNMPVLP